MVLNLDHIVNMYFLVFKLIFQAEHNILEVFLSRRGRGEGAFL